MISLGLGLGITSGGGPSDPWAGLVTDGLVAEWRFAEGSGNTVADEIGSNDIDLTAPTTPNVTWVAEGVRTQSGLVQTPSITCRTLVYLYRVESNAAGGFVNSGGSSSGDGQYTDLWSTTDTWHIGQHAGVAPVKYRASNGTGGEIAFSGGWRVVFREMGASRTSVFGFGNRHTLENLAVNDMKLGWVGAYDDTLTDAERLALYTTMRAVIASRGAYMDWRDCPTKANGVMMWGQSNMEGRAEIANLSAEDQAITFTKTKIATSGLGNSTVVDSTWADLDLGVNQQRDDPANEFGPETFFADSYENASPTRDLYISKASKGGSYLEDSSDANVAAGNTWSPDELATSNGIWQSAMYGWWINRAAALDDGVGIDLKAFCWMQGENDAEHDTTSAAYQTNLSAFIDVIREHTAVSGLPFIAGRIYNQSSPTNATWLGRVRDAIDAEADTSIDTDAYGIQVDGVHYNAAGMKALGQAFYAAAFP